jgi:hypothetical protein
VTACVEDALDGVGGGGSTIAEEKAVSPIIMSTRKGDKSPEIAFIVKLIREIYRKAGITFGV